VILVGDSIFSPAQDEAARYIPPVTLLWATLGRLTATGPDTLVALDGDTLRADIGRDPVWRAVFAGDRLVRVERLGSNHTLEWVSRGDSARVVYRQTQHGRTLNLTITRRLEESAFDEAIWRH
jgi:hypothetical protein